MVARVRLPPAAPSPPCGGSVAECLVASLAARGTRRFWGVPGGGSSLDVIEAARSAGLEFVLCRHEGSAAMMAVAEAELTGAPGVVLTTKGPGLSNAANGVSWTPPITAFAAAAGSCPPTWCRTARARGA